MASFELEYPGLFDRETLDSNPDLVTRDQGGVTKYGISTRANPDINVAALTRPEAKKLTYDRYWKPYRYEEIPQWAAHLAFDTMFNAGPGNGARVVQRALVASGVPVSVDGGFGPKTRAALNKVNKNIFIDNYKRELLKYYTDISKRNEANRRSLPGWKNRVKELYSQFPKSGGVGLGVVALFALGFMLIPRKRK